MASNIGLSRKQKVFIALEAIAGTLVWPNATEDFIRPAGNASINQTPAFSDSEELADTLDLLDQFENAIPAGTWEVPMYIRPAGTVGGKPQGGDLLESLQGSVSAASAGSLMGGITASIATIGVDGITPSEWPHVGAILIGTENIYYGGVIFGATWATFTGCIRGYGSTAATAALDNVDVALASKWYKQAITNPSVSIFVQTDHFVQALSGATINKATLAISNEGAVKITVGGNGMRMYWAGTSPLAATAAIAATQLTVDDAKLFTVGLRIYNKTKADDNSGEGFAIISVNTTTNVIALGTALAANWATDDEIAGFLPTGTVIGDPIESRLSSIEINDVSARIRTMDLNLDLPKKYVEDEIGATYPEQYIEDRRNISSTLALYFKKADAKYFQDGYNGNEVPVLLTFGNVAGSTMEVYLKRAILQVPTINFAPPAVELSIPMRALGTAGEDSCEILFH